MKLERDAAATRARLLDAASVEFAAHGVAGARIDRIAVAARANKQLIYAYFGSKNQLFEAVFAKHISALTDEVPLGAEDLAGYVGQLFDYLVAHPEVLRIAAWAHLEGRASLAEQDSYKKKLGAIAAAQRSGSVTAAIAPADLLAMLLALCTAWFNASEALRTFDTKKPASRKRLAQFRSAAVDAARCILGVGNGA